MSFDFQLGHACLHLTIEEVVPLGTDRRSLQTRQPISSANQVRVTANNNVNIPREGKFAPAILSSSFAGPFTVDKCARLLTVGNRTQVLTDFLLPVGTRLPTERIVDSLTRGLRDAGVNVEVSSSNGILQFKDLSELGPSSRIEVSGSAAESLGLTFQTRARGRQVYPSWTMAEYASVTSLGGTNTFKTVTYRYPQFSEPLKGNPVLKVSYVTYVQRCLRCQATGIENDIRTTTVGEPFLIRNEDLLNQNVLKMVITRKGSNPFHPSLGSTIMDKIGTKATGAAKMSINEDVTRAVTLFQRLQTAQAKVQQVSLKERLYSILSVNTTSLEEDPTVFQVNIVAQNASGEPVFISTVYAAPGAPALVGSNGLSLGLAPLGLGSS